MARWPGGPFFEDYVSPPSDDLVEFENAVAQRMGDNFDGDEGQQAIIFRWLDDVEAKMKELSPGWHAYLFASGPHPEAD